MKLPGICAPLVCLLAVSSALHAESGNLAGTVIESLRKTLLVGAEVAIEGTPMKTATDDSGRYTLLGVPAGKVKLTVSYLGMEPQTQEVTVAAGVTTPADFELTPSMKTSVTVIGEPLLEGQAKALNDQKNAINLVNLVASDQSIPGSRSAFSHEASVLRSMAIGSPGLGWGASPDTMKLTMSSGGLKVSDTGSRSGV